MGQRCWHGALAGATAGLAMLACALGLAGLGLPGCLRAFLDVALPALPRAPHVTTIAPVALAPGAALHETAAIAMGMVGLRALPPLARPLTGTIWLVGGGLLMALVDVAVQALRVPGLPIMVDRAQSVEYLAFGLVLAVCVLVLGPSRDPGRSVALGQRGQQGMAQPPDISRPAMRERAAVSPARPVLEVVVAPHCFGCTRARTLAAEVAARFPALEVRIVDLSQPGVDAPAGIVAVPAYILAGRVLFTGNPTPDALAAALGRAMAPSDLAGTD